MAVTSDDSSISYVLPVLWMTSRGGAGGDVALYECLVSICMRLKHIKQC